MAIIKEMTEKQQKEFDSLWEEWVESRPPIVQKMARAYPPNRLYRLDPTGQRVTILAYGEDGTVRVSVKGKYNFVLFNREVFGIDPANLEECELPKEDELLGTMFTEDEQVDELIGTLREGG